MGHPSRHRLLAAMLVAVFALAAGCGGANNALPKAVPPSASPTPTDPGVSVLGLDPSALDVSNVPGTDPGSNLSFASPIYTVKASSELTGPTKVQLLLDNALPRQSPVFVVTRRQPSNPWTFLPARLMSDQRHVEFTTTHLSDFGVLVMDDASALQDLRDDIHQGLDASVNAKVKKPTCDATTDAHKDGYSVGFSRGKKTLFWCFGLENDKRVLKVVNRRVVPIEVTHTTAAEINPTAAPQAWTTWAALLADKDTTFVAPGRTVTYDVDIDPLKRVLISASNDSKAQSLRALQATVRALVAQVTSFGAGKSNAGKTVAALVARPQCARTLGKGSQQMLAGCFSRSKMVATFGSRGILLARLTTDHSTSAFMRKQFRAIALDVVKNENQNILVRRAKPDFSAFVGTFTGTARQMSVNADGLVFESVSNVKDKKTTQVADVTYQLSEPETDKGVSTAHAVITKVKVYDRKAFNGHVPHVGDQGTFRLEKGVIRSPFVKRNYCGKGAKKNACS
jgi:hypothetical protein